jgi:hypothetical protein
MATQGQFVNKSSHRLALRNESGKTIESISNTSDTMQELYNLARRQALGIDQSIQKFKDNLDKL